MALKSDSKFERKLTCGLENDMRNFTIGTLMGSFCSKQKMYGFKIYRGVTCHENEE